MAAKKGTQKAEPKPGVKEPAKQQKQTANPQSIEVRIDRLIGRSDSNVKAVASINLGGFAVHGFRIMDSKKGLFVSMPSTVYTDKNGNTQYSDTFHPTTAESREELIHKMKSAYEQAVEELQNKKQDETEEEIPQAGPTM